jgi:transposase
MRQIRQMLRLARDGVSAREIGRTLGVARSTIQDNLKRAAAAGLAWPLPGELTDDALEHRLFARAGVKAGFRRRPEPDWAALARELKRPGVNLLVLWEEYREVHPAGYGYSRFCELFRGFERRLSPVLRQEHPAGDKVFVDYSGKTITIVARATGEVRTAEIFVRGARRLELHLCRGKLEPGAAGLDRRPCPHVPLLRRRAAADRAGQPQGRGAQGLVLRSRAEPQLRHDGIAYGVGVLPARPRRPRDKAKVEAGVRFAQSYILGRLRHQTFCSLAEANQAIAAVLERINGKVMRRLGVSRRQLFETVEQPALAPLPADDYEFAEWRLARVALDYHIEFDGFFYSVPHSLIREQVDLRATARTIEIFHRGRRVAAHQRRHGGRRHGTNPDHMPSAHRRYADWTPERFRRWGRSIGPETEGLVIAILAHRPHPEQGFRTCLGVLRLYRDLDPAHAEMVSARAVAIGALTYKSIAAIIANRLARKSATATAVTDHSNRRGPGYFH